MFCHENLEVYRRSIEFIAWSQPVLECVPAKLAARDQLDRASTSIALNIAEGNMKASMRERARYWQTALGSAFECAAAIDVLAARGVVVPGGVERGKALLREVASMLMALLEKLGVRVVGGER